MILYIAEKPSLGRAIAAALPKPHRQRNGAIETAGGTVSWCVGHLLEQAEPETYNAQFKRWRLDDLPIVPDEWKLKPRNDTKSQLQVLRQLVRQADQLVHAGDPDREGQLLVDEVLHYLKVPDAKLKATQRCLINDMTPAAVRTALNSLRSNTEFQALSTSALARSRADWLYGINMTRAFTLRGQSAGFQGMLSVGRVQTPLLGLIVRRDLSIRDFVPVDWFDVIATVVTDSNGTFNVRWQPSDACKPWLDEQGRNLSRPLAENVRQRVIGQTGTVTKVDRKRRTLSAPLPHSLSSLQIDANRVFGLSSQQVLSLCQSLYETHQLITYPRSDCRYLPDNQLADYSRVVTAVQSTLTECANDGLAKGITGITPDVFDALLPDRRSRAWNSSKVTAHHAIIPTAARKTSLKPDELKVYALVCRNYLAQFLPDHVFFETQVVVDIEGGKFRTHQRQPSVIGWKRLFGHSVADPVNSLNTPEQDRTDPASQGPEQDSQTLPRDLTVGQSVTCSDCTIDAKKTQPPKHFTDATLLTAMTGIARYVSDQSLVKSLADTDGLGTEATRAGMIELLIRRQYVFREKKALKASATGIAFIEALPDSITLPDRTAQWESQLTAIREKRSSYAALMEPLVKELYVLVESSRQITPTALAGLGSGRGSGSTQGSKRGAKRRSKRAAKVGSPEAKDTGNSGRSKERRGAAKRSGSTSGTKATHGRSTPKRPGKNH